MKFPEGGTFITLGNANQSFTRLLDCCVHIQHLLPTPIVVQHGKTIFSNPQFECHEYLSPDLFMHIMRASKVVIAHAGAGSIIHSIRLGKKPIIMPRLKENSEHINNHQLELAKQLTHDGYVYLASNLVEMTSSIKKALDESPKNITNQNQKIYDYIDASLRYFERSIIK